MSTVLNPLVKWAQNRTTIFLTIEVSNSVVRNLEIGDNILEFEGFGNGAHGENIYKLSLKFSNGLNTKKSAYKTSDRDISFSLIKEKAGYWDKLLVDERKPAWLRLDFDKWRGEDDSEDERQDAITKVSVERRNKEMAEDIEHKMQEAEEEVKEILIKGYLVIYNVVQSFAFFYITLMIFTKLFLHGSEAIPKVFDNVSDLVATCQIIAFIEPCNAWFKLVHTGVFAPLIQCCGRFIVLFLVITPNIELQKDTVVMVLFLSWSLIENVRYPFYATQTVGYCPKWLLWLRYTAWIPLYPAGLISEGILIFKAAYLFDISGRWTLNTPPIFGQQLTLPFSIFLRIYLIILTFGGLYLLKHMWVLRQKKYNRTRSKAKKQ